MSKTQVDRLGARLRSDVHTVDDLRELDQYRQTFDGAYQRVIDTIRDDLGLLPTGRPAKSTSAIVEKLRRETIRLSQIQDIAGVRLVTGGLRDQDQLVSRLMGKFPSAITVDRREHPSHGYRALHVVVDVDGLPVEVQVRTEMQHTWAEFSEKLADTIAPAVKYGGGPAFVQELLASASTVAARIEEFEKRAIEGPPATGADSSEWTKVEKIEFAWMKKDLHDLLNQFVERLPQRRTKED